MSIEVTFLGTSSMVPTKSRFMSSATLRFPGGGIWLFDCAEGTQIRINSVPNIKLSRIEVILISHLHGDHCFGLPGLLCSIGNHRSPSNMSPLIVIGTPGLRLFIATCLKISGASLNYPLHVYELITECNNDEVDDIDMISGVEHFTSLSMTNGHWTLPLSHFNDVLSLTAAPLSHSIASLGFVIHLRLLAGNLNMSVISPILVQYQSDFAAMGVLNPFTLLKQFKNGQDIILPNGDVMSCEDPLLMCGGTIAGLCIAFLGDTCDSSSVLPLLSKGYCDVLVHEATNAFLGPEDGSEIEVEARAKENGHSTPQMAGAFARLCRTKTLILTHFSSRYRGDKKEESIATMSTICNLAERVLCDGESDSINYCSLHPEESCDNVSISDNRRVIAARDLMTLFINLRTGRWTPRCIEE